MSKLTQNKHNIYYYQRTFTKRQDIFKPFAPCILCSKIFRNKLFFATEDTPENISHWSLDLVKNYVLFSFREFLSYVCNLHAIGSVYIVKYYGFQPDYTLESMFNGFCHADLLNVNSFLDSLEILSVNMQ